MKVRQLSDALKKVAEEEGNENEVNLESNLTVLRNWCHAHFGEQTLQTQDQWLVSFLRGCKNDLMKSQRKMENYYTLKKTAPEYFTNRNPFDEKIQALLNLGLFLPLRQTVKEDSPRTCLVRLSQLCNTEFDMADLSKIGFMIAELLLLEDDNYSIAGEDVVADMKDVGFSILRQWTPRMAMRTFACAQNALTVRIKSIHIINAPRGVHAVLAISKMFLTPKLKKRIYVYNNEYEGIYDYVPKSVLPAEYGGTDGNVQDLIDYWKTKVESSSDWYADFDKTCDEFITYKVASST